MVTDSGQIFDTATTDQNDRVFLKVMALIRDIGDNLVAIGKAHFGNLAHGRIGLLGGARHDLNADAPAKGRVLQGWRLGLMLQFAAALTDQLVYGRHLVKNR